MLAKGDFKQLQNRKITKIHEIFNIYWNFTTHLRYTFKKNGQKTPQIWNYTEKTRAAKKFVDITLFYVLDSDYGESNTILRFIQS